MWMEFCRIVELVLRHFQQRMKFDLIKKIGTGVVVLGQGGVSMALSTMSASTLYRALSAAEVQDSV